MRERPACWCGTAVTATVSGAMVAFAGRRSKPRFSLIGVDVDPLNVARTNAGTTHSAAAVTRMAIRARPAILIGARPVMLLEGVNVSRPCLRNQPALAPAWSRSLRSERLCRVDSRDAAQRQERGNRGRDEHDRPGDNKRTRTERRDQRDD